MQPVFVPAAGVSSLSVYGTLSSRNVGLVLRVALHDLGRPGRIGDRPVGPLDQGGDEPLHRVGVRGVGLASRSELATTTSSA